MFGLRKLEGTGFEMGIMSDSVDHGSLLWFWVSWRGFLSTKSCKVGADFSAEKWLHIHLAGYDFKTIYSKIDRWKR